jgi:phosphoribosylglycinamide formyltransferase 1
VRVDDSADTLAARVQAVEHRLYPQAVRWFVSDELRCVDGRVQHRDGAPQWLMGSPA